MQEQEIKKENESVAENVEQVEETAVEKSDIETDQVSVEDTDSDEDIVEVAENDEYRYIERVQVSNDKHKARLKEDFGWIGELKLINIDGQMTLQDPNGSYIISDTRIKESAFVHRWLDQFALGYVGKTNYFDASAWGKITHGHQRGVVITDDAGEPIFVIPPLSRAQFTPEEQYVLDLAHKSYTNASSAEETGDSHRAQEIITNTSNLIKTYVSDESITLTDLVPDWFYAKYNVIPYVKRSMIYCRDVYGLNPAIKLDWDMAESIFTAIHNKHKLTDHQLTFMEILTDGEFTPPEYEPVENSGDSSLEGPSNSEDFDPFEN